MPAQTEFYRSIDAAIADMTLNGYDSAERLEFWLVQIRKAAINSLIPEHVLAEQLRRVFGSTYARLVDRDGILRLHTGIPRFTLARVKPRLRGELDRRILASANLIKLNRQQSVERTLQRFSGWASSVPAGGSKAVDRRAILKNVRKPLASLSFEERRVMIDQGHKFTAALSNILATDGGAIAGIWHSHWRQPGYDYREDHKERDELVYAIRGNWAMERGLMKAGAGYTDQITKPGEEVFCRCQYQFLYALRDLPEAMLTAKGRAELKGIREAA